jgi:predicted RNA methylase
MGKHITNIKFDQYYTSKWLALECINYVVNNVEIEYRQLYLEPSAGIGSFLQADLNDKYIAMDIDPKANNIIKFDYLKSVVPTNWQKNIVTIIGNPPFGHAGNLAIKFFNHSTLFADTICFILPRSFKKISIQNKLNMQYNLTFEKDLGNNGFILENGGKYRFC